MLVQTILKKNVQAFANVKFTANSVDVVLTAVHCFVLIEVGKNLNRACKRNDRKSSRPSAKLFQSNRNRRRSREQSSLAKKSFKGKLNLQKKKTFTQNWHRHFLCSAKLHDFSVLWLSPFWDRSEREKSLHNLSADYTFSVRKNDFLRESTDFVWVCVCLAKKLLFLSPAWGTHILICTHRTMYISSQSCLGMGVSNGDFETVQWELSILHLGF